MRLNQFLDLIANPVGITFEICNATLGTRLFYGTFSRLLNDAPELLDCIISDIWLPDSAEFTTTISVYLK